MRAPTAIAPVTLAFVAVAGPGWPDRRVRYRRQRERALEQLMVDAEQEHATKERAAASADILPGLPGVGSVVVIPGLVAIWATLTVLHRDRRQLGLATGTAGSQIWDNKLWLLAAAAVSLVAAMLYSVAGFADLLDPTRRSRPRSHRRGDEAAGRCGVFRSWLRSW
jgi:hypothetical protein